MNRKRHSQKEIPTPKPKREKQIDKKVFILSEHIVSRVSSYRRPLSYPNLTKTMKTYIRFKQLKNLLQNIKRIEPHQNKKVEISNAQEMAQSERNSHSTNRGVGKNLDDKWGRLVLTNSTGCLLAYVTLLRLSSS